MKKKNSFWENVLVVIIGIMFGIGLTWTLMHLVFPFLGFILNLNSRIEEVEMNSHFAVYTCSTIDMSSSTVKRIQYPCYKDGQKIEFN